MRSDDNPVYILSSARIPFVKSQTIYSKISRKDLMLASLDGLIQKTNLKGVLVGDTALGAVITSASDWNLARECILASELDQESPAYNVQRACGTSLETVWQIALKAYTGAIDFGIAGGVDTNSDLPIEVSDEMKQMLIDYHNGNWSKALSHLTLSAFNVKIPTIREPTTHLLMGEHCELMIREWGISREAQDAFAYKSHMNGVKAYENGFYDDLVIPYQGLKRDQILRSNTSLEKLAKLPPAFDKINGTLTAGNSSPLTDGSACVLIGNNKGAEKLKLKPLAKIIDVQVAAVDFVHGAGLLAGLLMAPTKAIPELLKRNHLSLQDFDYYEIHEAFAGQVLCNLKALESTNGPIDPEKINIVGGSVAIGHPFAATGARLTGTLAKLLSRGKNKRGLISVCTAGGMGMAAILESV